MPTLVWVRRPESGTSDGARREEAATAAVPDPVVSAAAAVPDACTAVSASSATAVQVALPNVSGKKKRKLKMNLRVEAATATKKESEETDDETSALKAETDDEDTNVLKEETDGEEEAEEIEASLPKSSRRKQPSRKAKHNISNASDEDQDSLSLGSESKEYGSNNETLSNQHADGRKTKRNAHGGKKKKRKKNPRANAGASALKISKTAFGRDLPRGVTKTSSGKYQSEAWWGGKTRKIGRFDTPEQASAAYMSVRKDRDDAKLSAVGADEANATFDKARKKALESLGIFVQAKRDLPRGVKNTSSGKFQSVIKWGSKGRHIGTFDTPEQASAAYMSVKKDLDDANLSALGVDEVQAILDGAKKNVLASFGGFVPEERDLPRGVTKKKSGRFQSGIWWGSKTRYIGTFDTPKQASAAYISAKTAKQSACGSSR